MSDKASIIEFIENLYGLATNFLITSKNYKLEQIIKELEFLENQYEFCENIKEQRLYEILLEDIYNKIEVIINE